MDNFKFGKVDIGRYPDAATKYHISDSSTSKQLPTLILFKEGKEVERRPYADHKGKLVKFLFSIVSQTIFSKIYENFSKSNIFPFSFRIMLRQHLISTMCIRHAKVI